LPLQSHFISVDDMARIQANTSDADLIHLLRGGQGDALGILYDRYGGLVYTVAFKVLNRTDEAEDLTQEVFLNFWKQERFDPNRAGLSTYLCVMTRSRAINKLRSRSSQQRMSDRLQQATPAEFSAPTPLEQASLSEQQQTVRQALSQLSDKQRQVLELNYYQGLSQSEVAQRLELPLGTVKTHARQGLIKLRQILGDAVG
jgi:RNA polymerase sigma-70 factor, ECF subfamily